jgi:hypothetical protein
MSDEIRLVTLTELERELEEAVNDYQVQGELENIARSRATTALNRLNAAQMAFDARIDEMRKQAPQSSDWRFKVFAVKAEKS